MPEADTARAKHACAAPAGSLDLGLAIADGDLKGRFEVCVVGSQDDNVDLRVECGPHDLECDQDINALLLCWLVWPVRQLAQCPVDDVDALVTSPLGPLTLGDAVNVMVSSVALGATKHPHCGENGPLLSRIALPRGSQGDDLLREQQRVDQTLVNRKTRGREEVARGEVDVLVVDDDTDPQVHHTSKKNPRQSRRTAGNKDFSVPHPSRRRQILGQTHQTRIREQWGDTRREMAIRALLTWNDGFREEIDHLGGRTPTWWAGYAVGRGQGSGCGSARRMSR